MCAPGCCAILGLQYGDNYPGDADVCSRDPGGHNATARHIQCAGSGCSARYECDAFGRPIGAAGLALSPAQRVANAAPQFPVGWLSLPAAYNPCLPLPHQPLKFTLETRVRSGKCGDATCGRDARHENGAADARRPGYPTIDWPACRRTRTPAPRRYRPPLRCERRARSGGVPPSCGLTAVGIQGKAEKSLTHRGCAAADTNSP